MLISPDRSQLLVVDVQERLLPAIDGADAILANLGVLVEAASCLEVPVTVSEQYPKGLGATVPAIADHPAADVRLGKLEFSCARNGAITDRVVSLGRQQMVIAGVEAHVCVLQSALDFASRGHSVHVVADATGSRRPGSKATALARLQAAGVTVVTTEMVVFEWLGSAGTDVFRRLSKLIR